MNNLKLNGPEDFHFLEQISDGIEVAFYDYIQSETNTTIGELLFKPIIISESQLSPQILDLFDVGYEAFDKDISIARKDMILLLCAVHIEKVTKNRELAKEIIQSLEKLYFCDNQRGKRLDMLSYHIVNILYNQIPAYLYIYDTNIARFASIDQHLTSLLIDKPLYGHIQIDLSTIVYKIFKGTDAPSMKDSIYTLNDNEVEILAELRLQRYAIKNINIKFDINSIPEELQISGIELDLERYKDLDEMIEHGEIAKKKYRNKSQYIKIKEIKNLERKKK